MWEWRIIVDFKTINVNVWTIKNNDSFAIQNKRANLITRREKRTQNGLNHAGVAQGYTHRFKFLFSLHKNWNKLPF